MPNHNFSTEEIKDFCNVFYQTKEARTTRVEIMPDTDPDKFCLNLTSEKTCTNFSEASFRAVLTAEEIIKFCGDFLEVKSASRTTRVEIMPDGKHINFCIVLTAEKTHVKLLEDAFYGGLLGHWDWPKKFKQLNI